MAQILLTDIMHGLSQDAFNARFPGYRRKLRFSKSWDDVAPDGTVVHRDPHEMYRTGDAEFLPSILTVGDGTQRRVVENDITFQFIEIRPHKWLFVGAYKTIDLNGVGINPYTKKSYPYANAEYLKEFDCFAGRVVVDFTNSPQRFYYTSADIIDRIVVSEVLSDTYLELSDDFPGYDRVSRDYKALSVCMTKPDWKNALSGVYGVYVITDGATGRQYVGSAYGENGVYGRWSVYLANGYDDSDKDYPNKRLKELVKKHGMDYVRENFTYTLIEIFPKNDVGRERALARESYWKEVLQTRQFGYNDN